MLRDKDLEPLRVVAADGKEWGRGCFGALTIAGGGGGGGGKRGGGIW